MKPDSMLVELEHLVRAGQDIATKGTAEALDALGKSEPALASFLSDRLSAVAGNIALCGAPTPVVQGVHEECLMLVLTCVQALRHGHYALWKDSLPAGLLARLDPSPAPKPGRRRKEPGEGGGEPRPGPC
jgi:hypothetical protein